jgi:hypothetical protein
MKVVAINSPYVDAEDLSAAEFIIDGYDELNALLKTWQPNP